MEKPSKFNPFKSFDRFFHPFLIDRKGHPDIAFSFLSKTISRGSDDPSLIDQERGELGGGISHRNSNPEIEGGLPAGHFQPNLLKTVNHHISSFLINVDDFRKRSFSV